MCIIISLEWNIQLTVHRYPAKYIQIVVCRLKLMICCFTNLFILKTSFLLPFMTCLKSEYTSLFRFISKSNKKDSSCKNLKPLQHSHTNLFLICHKIQTKSPTLILLLYSTDCSFLQRWSVSVHHKSEFYFTVNHSRQRTQSPQLQISISIIFFLVAEDKQVSDHSNQ